MPYADVTYYKNVYKGNIVPDSDIEKYLQRASDSVDIVTFMRLKDLSLGEFQETRVKMAVCYQADYLYQYENFLDLGAKGYSIGDVSVSLEGSGTQLYSRQMLDSLRPTGFMNRYL